MEFHDNFVAVTPDCLMDPQLKLRMASSGTKEIRRDGTITVAFDPEISEDQLTLPRSMEERSSLARNPILAHLADRPVPFKSSKSEFLFNFNISWRICDDTLELYLTDSKESLLLSEASVSRKGIPVVSEFSRDVMLYSLRCVADFSAIGHEKFPSPENPSVKRIVVLAKTDIAEDFFGLVEKKYRNAGEDVELASREIVQ